jgi:hypothetical protein
MSKNKTKAPNTFNSLEEMQEHNEAENKKFVKRLNANGGKGSEHGKKWTPFKGPEDSEEDTGNEEPPVE